MATYNPDNQIMIKNSGITDARNTSWINWWIIAMIKSLLSSLLLEITEQHFKTTQYSHFNRNFALRGYNF